MGLTNLIIKRVEYFLMIWERKSHYKGIGCKTFGDATISTCFECTCNFTLQLF
jgi:hypothetical protein